MGCHGQPFPNQSKNQVGDGRKIKLNDYAPWNIVDLTE
jgi:hypothetical protein